MLFCGVQVMLGSGAASETTCTGEGSRTIRALFSLPGFVPRRSSPGSSGTGTPESSDFGGPALLGGPGSAGPDRDRPCDVLRIAADAVDHRRRHRIQKVKADEVEPRLARDDPAVVHRLSVRTEHWEVDPRK